MFGILGNIVFNTKNSNISNRSIPLSPSCVPVCLSVPRFLAFSCENRERKKLTSLKETIKLEKLNSLIFRLFLKLDEIHTCNALVLHEIMMNESSLNLVCDASVNVDNIWSVSFNTNLLYIICKNNRVYDVQRKKLNYYAVKFDTGGGQ